MKRLRELKGKNAELEKQMRIEQSHSAFKLYRKEMRTFTNSRWSRAENADKPAHKRNTLVR